MNNEDIGEGNEKAINQMIAHHSIIFEPVKKLVWVSTGPWQLGAFVCYNLDKVFSQGGMKTDKEIADSSLGLPADSFLLTNQYQQFLKFRAYRRDLLENIKVNPDSLIASNPDFYQSYQLAANEMYKEKHFELAIAYYRQALTKEIATKKEENEIRDRINNCEAKLK